MNIGILALQGAVSEHKSCMYNLGTDVIEVKKPNDLNGIHGLIMPGGESTTLRKLLKNSGLWKAIKEMDFTIFRLPGRSKQSIFK